MVRKGQAAKALGVGVVFSFLGTIFSTVLLMFIAPQIARVAINVGPMQFFAIAIFSLTMIATLSSGNMVKGVMAGVIGFMFSTVGTDSIEGMARYTFGSTALKGGFDMLAVMVGLFAVGEIIAAAQTSRHNDEELMAQPSMKGIKGFGFSIAEFFSQTWNALRSALIGMGIGILPGIGGGTSNVISYSIAKNQSKYPEKFGTGIVDGIVASEAANNASVGGALIPLLTLGIPGDAVTAILLGGLIMKGVNPGPLLFVNNGRLIYAIYFACIISTLMMFVIEFLGLRMFVRILKVPKHYLLPVVMALCVVGTFAINNRVFDVWSCLIFGVVGFLFKTFRFPESPFILGFMLGGVLEQNLIRSIQYSDGSVVLAYTKQPIAMVFLLVALAVVVWKPIMNAKNKKTA
jgi:putative tricarboxylic transport membrane protein